MRNLALALAALALCPAPGAAQSWRSAYPEATNEMYVAMRVMLMAEDVLTPVVEPLNESFPVERPVTIELAECGRVGSYYDGGRPAVGVCYELVERLAEAMMGADAGEEGASVFAGAFAYVLMHQVGHALADQLELSVSAGPEEAADQLTAVMASFSPEDAANTLMGALALRDLALEWEGAGQLSRRRAEEMACLFYGSDPQRFAWAVEEGDLPVSRAGGCAKEFAEVRDEWIELLAGAIAP